MMIDFPRRFCSVSCLLLMAGAVSAAEPGAADAEFFEKKIRPVLVQHCGKCHSAESPKLKGKLRVDGRDHLLKGGDNGPALVPGQPEKSRLIEAIGYGNTELQMPPDAKLSADVIADLTEWVKRGAPWPGATSVKVSGPDDFNLAQRKAEHWVWKPIQRGVVPTVKNTAWPLAASDRFLLAKLEAKGLTPAKQAEPQVLLRRIYFDLIGLPPTPQDLDVFVKEYGVNPQPALASVIDKLLASKQFGERWARHWLDLTRYAESRGHEFEPNIPNAWQYRDYVIRAFNQDVPYHRFVMEQMAGDLLVDPRLHPTEGFNESILGTGFWHLGEEVHSPVDIRADEADRFDNRIDVMTKTFLGLTVACARCHDHKFDAISARDYYAFYGFLRGSSYRQARFDSLEQHRQLSVQLDELRSARRGAILKAYADALQPGIERLPELLKQAREALRSGKPSSDALVQAWVDYLKKASTNEDDPFHAWTLLAGKEATPKTAFPPLLERWNRRSADHAAAWKNLEVIVDYAALRPGEWLTDEASYGRGPVHAGTPSFGNDANRPITRFVERSAAEFDPFWRGLKLSPGTQNDHGALGATVRSGKTIHSPGFEVKPGRVWMLVKGNGRSYAAVDAHTVIAGPLHGALVMNFNTNGKYQWVAHDLKSYVGHRAHIELTPNDDNDFAVAAIVQSEKPPPAPALPNALIRQAVTDATDADMLAAKLGRVFSGLLVSFGRDDFHTTSSDAAQLANWLIEHTSLLGSPIFDKVATVARPFFEERSKLSEKIRHESRLAPAMMDGSGVNERVFIRGSHKAPGVEAPRRFLEALAGAQPIAVAQGSGRLELARQMIDPAINPLITRVMVNRVWHHLFGRGIVASTDNFGVLGERPTHPELLDHLAIRFVEQGWSIKKLIRELMLSRAYQMASQRDEKADAIDPDNLLLHRAHLRRLQGEAIRDALLFISGRLSPNMHGPSVPIHLTPFLDGRGRPASGPIDGDGRRSIYLAVRRNFLSPFLLAFDTPSPFSTVGRRTVSNVPAQALIMMNDPFVHQQADLWGRKLAVATSPLAERIEMMYRQAFTRPPTEQEKATCLQFIESRSSPGGKSASDPKTWSELAHILFNVKEFIFLE